MSTFNCKVYSSPVFNQSMALNTPSLG